MSKVVIIGIDGFDPFLLKDWNDILPNLRRVINDNSRISIDSTIPPDSVCAWISIFTGENPAEHGLIETIDYLSSKKKINSTNKVASIKGKTIWDIISKKGKRVCIINPFLAYPAWRVNGVMVSGPVFEGGELSAYPGHIFSEYKFPPLGGMVDFPDEKELNKFVSHVKKSTEILADVSLKMFNDQSPDLFFVTFLTLDRIKHFLWRFFDKDDPYYIEDNPFSNVIKESYVLFDNIVGKFIQSLRNDYTLLIISDHGHRRRCVYSLNLNELLRSKGYIITSGCGTNKMLKKLIEKLKIFTISTLSKFDLQDYIYKIAKFIPNRKALKKSTYLIDVENSSAILSNLCGANPYGGIDVKAKSKMEYNRIRNIIIKELYNINEILGKNIVKWAKNREEIYKGVFEKRLPDLMFELDEEYGVGMNLYTQLITPNYTHRKISGGHKKEGVLLVYSSNKKIKKINRPDSIIGLKDYILEIMGIFQS